MAAENKRTVLLALGANLAIAAAKLVGGLVSGSVAMLAEAAHSVGDTVNEVFLFVSLSLGSREPDEAHPFGYGKERFFWAFLAAMFIFVAGAVFAFIEGVRALTEDGGHDPSYLVAYLVLAVAFVAESTSLIRAVRQVRREAEEAERGFAEHLRASKDPTVKVVVLEDSAAIIGIAIAAASLALHQLTGDHRWDALGSIAIGMLLTYVAFALGRDTKDLLLGESALPEQRDAIRQAIARHPEVEEVFEVLTMAVGPHDLLTAVRARFVDGLSGSELAAVASRIERDVRTAEPEVGQFFLDPTPLNDKSESHRPARLE